MRADLRFVLVTGHRDDFLAAYYASMSVLIHEADFYELAMAYFARASADGCHHAEVFFDPQAHTERGVHVDTVVRGFDAACRDAATEYGMSTRLILCILRHLPAEHGLLTLDSAGRWYDEGVIHGLGLDSSEKPFPPQLFVSCYEAVRQRHPNARLTAHAGEEGDHTYVTSALDDLAVARIDHGVNSQHDEVLLARLAADRTMLSLCPLSNVKLQVVKDVSELPIDLFLAKNVAFSINSDDPAYFGGYILDNYVAVHTRFGFTHAQWRTIALNGIEGSWCSEERKAELRDKVHHVYAKYATGA